MYSSQELYGAQNCPYTLPSFSNSNSSHGCRYTRCVDTDSNPAPPLPPAPETHHPKLLIFPSDLPLLQFSHLSEMAPLASVLPVWKPQMEESSSLSPTAHSTQHYVLLVLLSNEVRLSYWFSSHLQLKHHPLSPGSLWRPPPSTKPQPALSPATPVLPPAPSAQSPPVAPL